MEESKQNRKCTACKQFITDDIFYNGDPSHSVGELVALEKDTFRIYNGHGVVEDKEVPSVKVTSFTIYDKFNHMCPIDTGLIDKGVKLNFSGYIKTIDDEDCSVVNGTSVFNVGPIKEWWIYGYDGGETSVIGLTTDLAFYYLMKPSLAYEPFFKNVPQKTRLSKLVIEFLLDFGWQNPTFEDLVQHVKNFGEFCEVEELLFREAQFLCNQILSYDEETTDDIPMISYSCVQSLIKLTGITLNKGTGFKINKDITKTKNNSVSTKVTTTNIVRDVFERFFYERKHKSDDTNHTEIYNAKCDMKYEKTQDIAGPGRSQKCKIDQRHRKSLGDIDSSTNEQDEIGSKPIKHKECSKQILHTVKWLKKSTMKYNDCQGYSSVSVEDFIVQQGDYVILQSDSPDEPMRVAVVSYMYDSPLVGAMFHAHFFCRGTDTILGETADPRELFVVDDCDDYPVGCIVKKAEVEFRKIPSNWANLGGQVSLPVELEDNERNYFFSKIYDYEFSRFKDYNDMSFESDHPCMSCRLQRKIKDYESPTYEDGYILWRNEIYKIGSAVFLEPGQTNSIQPIIGDRKEILDNEIYPEIYRKKCDMNRDSNLDTPEPFTVGLIEDIRYKKSKDIKIKVRMFYRPEDTQGSLFYAYVQDINYLYWTHDVIWTTFKNVSGKCYLTFTDNIELGRKWSENGPFRFYYSKAYHHKNLEIYEVPIEGKIYCSDLNANTTKVYELRNSKTNFVEKIYESAPGWAQLDIPLKCMDIYAGCGGLSEGLHQAGVSRTLWAIEKEMTPAQAFHLNNPECRVYTDDCNNILEIILSGNGKSIGLPDKGDVDLLVGGPPCQGFSAMNRFNNGHYSYQNNSQIITFLSYCDYYRPKYLIFENVRNFVSFKKGIIFKLVLKCLLAMGYQLSFGILQAGNFGLPQTRRRFILMGAAPSYTVPRLPEPLHVFKKSGTFLSIIIDGLRYDTGSYWTDSLPYRTICVRDAIADLPEIKSGSMSTQLPYDEPAKSYFQRHMRKMNKSDLVKDHICKELSSLVEARVSHIPIYAGADWRDLPNKVVKLKDGSLTNILNYRYRTKTQNKLERPRGVCKCATRSDCDPSDRQFNTLIPWCLSHTADRHNNWVAVYGRLEWDGYFGTTITNPEPMGTQGRVLHPEQDRVVSVRECARSQGFHDEYIFCGNILDKHRQIGNAVPPPLALALGREIMKAHNNRIL